MGAEAEPNRGVVLGAVGGVYTIELIRDKRVIEASLRGRLKRERRTGDRIAAGDRVEVKTHDDGAHTIEAVAERENELARRASGRRTRRAQVIVANVERMAAVVAAAEPEPDRRMLDRFLVLAEANSADAIIIINKVDLVDPADVRDRFGIYERIGYTVLYVSAREDRGMDAVRNRLCDGTSVLTGPSGVGKSSILNAVEPGLARRVGEVGKRAGMGRHTTVAVELVPLACGGYVADTPGLSEVGLWGVPLGDLAHCFPEFQAYLAGCRFGYSCTHLGEPGCAISQAVEAEEIDSARYESYTAIRASEEGEAWRTP